SSADEAAPFSPEGGPDGGRGAAARSRRRAASAGTPPREGACSERERRRRSVKSGMPATLERARSRGGTDSPAVDGALWTTGRTCPAWSPGAVDRSAGPLRSALLRKRTG